MKLFKLTKTLDYINHPLYEELLKISNAVSDSIGSLRNMFLSAFISTLFSLIFINENTINSINVFLSSCMGPLDKYLLSLLLYSLSALIIYYILRIVKHFKNEWTSNKDTSVKRKALAHKFYSLAVPQLIEVRSIQELIEEKYTNITSPSDIRVKKLLLHQAKHGICVLYDCLEELNIVDKEEQQKKERKKIRHHFLKQKNKDICGTKEVASKTKENDKLFTGKNSDIVLHLIGRAAYSAFLIEMLNTMQSILEELSQYNDQGIYEDLKEICTLMSKESLFVALEEVKEEYDKIKKAQSQILCKHQNGVK